MSDGERRATEVVGLFDTFDFLQTAVDELQITGIDRQQISVVGSTEALQVQYGDAELSSSSPSEGESDQDDEISVGEVVGGLVGGLIAAGGLLIPSAAVTTIALGGLGGAVVTEALSDESDDNDHARIRNRINDGEFALCVTVSSDDEETKVKSILEKHHGSDIQRL